MENTGIFAIQKGPISMIIECDCLNNARTASATDWLWPAAMQNETSRFASAYVTIVGSMPSALLSCVKEYLFMLLKLVCTFLNFEDCREGDWTMSYSNIRDNKPRYTILRMWSKTKMLACARAPWQMHDFLRILYFKFTVKSIICGSNNIVWRK